jgi:hypothetical protein
MSELDSSPATRSDRPRSRLIQSIPKIYKLMAEPLVFHIQEMDIIALGAKDGYFHNSLPKTAVDLCADGRGAKVDRKLEFRRLSNRQVSWLRARQSKVGVDRDAARGE